MTAALLGFVLHLPVLRPTATYPLAVCAVYRAPAAGPGLLVDVELEAKDGTFTTTWSQTPRADDGTVLAWIAESFAADTRACRIIVQGGTKTDITVAWLRCTRDGSVCQGRP